MQEGVLSLSLDLFSTKMFFVFADHKMEMDEEREIYTNADLNNYKSKKQEVQKAAASQPDSATYIDQRNAGDFESRCSNTQEDSRPASPGTQALMCDEQGNAFGTDYSSSFPVALHDQDTSELNALQEKAVLTGFRDYLRILITRGKINGEMNLLRYFYPSITLTTSH